jgi:hypothetical protein
MNAVAVCAAKGSFLGFAAALRALIESTGDSADVLAKIPKNVAKDYRPIKRCVEGSQENAIFASRGMEDELISYSHARWLKKGEGAPKSHVAKPTQYYIDLLDETAGLPNIPDLYRILCGIMHPAAESVAYH